ncbi:unnamed protein product [Sphenostylis stenocarpa]|uniref:L-ascorbate oxidase n=1 Tax=Sphenostylis stenocarpa TaxID=92480 RepID=A0AA86SQ98_9FABA|nr:unnamed protein product [Sphenostylis stenocarpa]
MGMKTVFVWFIWLGLVDFAVGGRVRHYKFDVEYMIKSPDCLEHVVMGINGQFPGPTIRAEVGDTLDIALTNKLFTEGTVIHSLAWNQTAWNIFLPWSPWYASSRVVWFINSRFAKGTKEPFHYDGEFNLLLSDLWHTGSHEQEVGLSTKPLKWIDEPQTLLINGSGQFNCSLAAKFTNTTLPQCQFKGGEKCAPQILHVEPNKTYRIRIASTTSLAALNLAISNHKLVVVEADGNYVTPFAVDDMDIYSGESYSVLLRTDQYPNKNYWLSVGVRGRKPNTTQGLTILNYKSISASVFPTSPPPITPIWNDFERSKAFTKKIIAKMGTPQPPKRSDRTIFLLNTQNRIDGEIHPWHLHGHDFWVLGYGEGKFKQGDEKKFNLTHAPLRNTAVIFPYGWTALRFKADNPVGKIPRKALTCGLTGKKLVENGHY